MLRRVHLHGPLRSIHPEPITVTGDTAAEVIEGITRQLPGFQPHPTLGRKRIKVVGFDTHQSLYQPLGDRDELHIVPQLNGGKDGNSWIQIVIGAALVAVSFALPAAIAPLALKVGALIVLGGLAQLLAPQPETNDTTKSRYLGTPKNTVQIGTHIPILYGKARVYGQFLSFDINAQEFRGSATAGGGGGK